MKIFIPSLNRADQKWHTWDGLPPSVQKDAYMVVGPKDAPAYFQRFGEDNVLVVDIKGIGAVRQHIIDISDGAVLMLDDDLSFFTRREDDPKLLQKADKVAVRAMITRMARLLEQYAHASIAVREGANRNPHDELLFNQRCLRALGYHAPTLKELGVRFDRLPVMEDFDVALQLLRKGFPSATLNRWCQDQGASNAPGGCSSYRSLKVQSKGARGLAKLHPDYVTVVQKEAKGGGEWAVREDVRVQWKKAFEQGEEA
jgi:hypothetical protein